VADCEDFKYFHASIVATITAAEQRRQQNSSIYITLISAGIAAFSKVESGSQIFLAIALLLIAIVWLVKTRSYLQLSKAKWKVVTEIEENFVYKPFTREWQIFNQTKNPMLKLGIVALETIIPALVTIASIVYIIYWIYVSLCH
jgi:hypothetical protein